MSRFGHCYFFPTIIDCTVEVSWPLDERAVCMYTVTRTNGTIAYGHICVFVARERIRATCVRVSTGVHDVCDTLQCTWPATLHLHALFDITATFLHCAPARRVAGTI
jgi:hypothetical protein